MRLSFQAMVGIGTLLALIGLVYLYLRVRRRALPRWLCLAVVAAGPLSVVALIAGWITTEVGRGLLAMRHSGLDLLRGTALALVCVSGAAGLITMALCWRSRFGLARMTAALAVAAVVAGWAAAQAPRFLPGMTVLQAATGRSTLVAFVISVACGSVVLIPSLALLFTLLLRGRLDMPESAAAADGAVEAATRAVRPAGEGRRTWARALGASAVTGLAAGAGLLVFADSAWAHALGVAGLVVCAVSVFLLATTPPVAD